MYTKIVTVLFLFSLILTGCGQEDYEFNTEKSKTANQVSAGDVGDESADLVKLESSKLATEKCTKTNASDFVYISDNLSIYNVEFRFTKVSMCIAFMNNKPAKSATICFNSDKGAKYLVLPAIDTDDRYQVLLDTDGASWIQPVSVKYDNTKFECTEIKSIGDSTLKNKGTNTLVYSGEGTLVLYDCDGFIVDFKKISGKGEFTTVNGCKSYKLMKN